MRTRSLAGAAIAMVGMLLTASCSGSDSASDAGSSPDSEVTVAPTVVPSTTAPATTSPTTTGPATTAPATTLSTTIGPTTTGPRTYDFSAISPIVQTYVDEHGLNGAGLIVVDRDDGVVHEDYWGEFSADRISLVASSTKMITAGVLLHLADAGLVDMDAPVADAVDWGSGNPTITPAQLVSSSSGLPGLADQAPSHVCQFLVAGALQDCAATIFTTPDDDADVIPPDTEFRYGGGQWQVAGGLAEAVSGKSWAELIDEIYVAPCDLDTLGYTNPFTQREIGGDGLNYPSLFEGDVTRLVPTDNPNLEGGAYVTTGDYAKLLLMQLRGGMCGDEQVLSQASLERMHSDRIGAVYGGETPTGSGYGMGWWVDKASGLLTDPGAFGAVPWLDLEDGYGAYLVIESDATTGYLLASQLFDTVDAAVGAAR